jgi:hypothetical protein
MTDETQGAVEPAAEDLSAAQPAENEATAQDQGQDLADDAGAAADDQPQQRPRQSAQERINELTRERREAEREAEYWRSRATQPPREAQPEAQAQPGEGRPDPGQYGAGEFDPQYLEDLTDWKAEQAVQRHLNAREQQSRVSTAIQTFNQRVSEQFPEGEPDGIANLRRLPQLSPVIQDIVTTVEAGPKIADHLGSNPRELQRISALPPAMQAFELAKLDQRLSAPPTPQPKTVSDAPPVTPTVRGQGGRFAPAPDTDDFAAFEKTYGD